MEAAGAAKVCVIARDLFVGELRVEGLRNISERGW